MSFAIKIGNYRFSKNLGDGNFGKVKRKLILRLITSLVAYNELTGNKVAIKILNRKKIKAQGVLEKVRREIKTLRKFNHPHIIKHFEFIDTPSDIFIVLEYAANGELYDYISRREKVSEFSFNLLSSMKTKPDEYFSKLFLQSNTLIYINWHIGTLNRRTYFLMRTTT